MWLDRSTNGVGSRVPSFTIVIWPVCSTMKMRCRSPGGEHTERGADRPAANGIEVSGVSAAAILTKPITSSRDVPHARRNAFMGILGLARVLGARRSLAAIERNVSHRTTNRVSISVWPFAALAHSISRHGHLSERDV